MAKKKPAHGKNLPYYCGDGFKVILTAVPLIGHLVRRVRTEKEAR